MIDRETRERLVGALLAIGFQEKATHEFWGYRQVLDAISPVLAERDEKRIEELQKLVNGWAIDNGLGELQGVINNWKCNS